jgi:hypothetical protein
MNRILEQLALRCAIGLNEITRSTGVPMIWLRWAKAGCVGNGPVGHNSETDHVINIQSVMRFARHHGIGV